jgi:hypothetical protein
MKAALLLAVILPTAQAAAQVGGMIAATDSFFRANRIVLHIWAPGVQRTIGPLRERHFRSRDFPNSPVVHVQAFAPGWVSQRMVTSSPDTSVYLVMRRTADTLAFHTSPAGAAAGLLVRDAFLTDSIFDRERPPRIGCHDPTCWMTYDWLDPNPEIIRERRKLMDPLKPRHLYLRALVEGGTPGRYVEHVWYLDERVVARVRLPVSRSPRRHWSRITIPGGWLGFGRVDVLSDNGVMLTYRRFQFDPPEGRPRR